VSATGPEPSEEELRAAYEAEIKKIRVEQILLENVVTLINLGMRRTGLAPGTEDERDPVQVRIAIEAIRALLPLVEAAAPGQSGPIKEALSQLQLAFVQINGPGGPGEPGEPGEPARDAPAPAAAGDPPAPESPETPASEPGKPGEPGTAQRSGKLWVPGQ
jgi:hypothetical protein